MTKTTVQAGDTIHALEAVFLFGKTLVRGDDHRLTEDDIKLTVNRHGESWITDLSEEAQATRWGRQRFGIGPFAATGLSRWIPGSPDADEERERRRKAAWRIDDPTERAEEMAKIVAEFGQARPTSNTIASPTSSPEQRAAEAQRKRLDAEGVRSKSKYTPLRREA